MQSRYFGLSRSFWFGGAALAIVSAALMVGSNPMSVFAKNGASNSNAWYAASPSSGVAPSASTDSTPGDNRAVEAATQSAKAMSKAFHAATMKVAPAVVTITSLPTTLRASVGRKATPGDEEADDLPFGLNGTPGDLLNDPRFRELFKKFHGAPNAPNRGSASSGSGVIVDPSGVILTNNHVVAGGGQITVRLSDGREFKAASIKTDPKTDLAIVRIEANGSLPSAKLGRSGEVEVGDWVLALGQPFGLENTVTAGIVSAKGRGLGITDREDFIQTDAAINPGNSGGPLVSLDGEVIGINTAISTNSGGYQGVGFAIPIDLAKWVGGQLEQSGAVHRAYLGVMIEPVTQERAEQLKLKVHSGVLVREVRDNTPAAKAGLQPGDVILKFAGQDVNSPRELQNIVERSPIGAAEPIFVLRDGKEATYNIACRELPADAVAASDGPAASRSERGARSNFEQLGLLAETYSAQSAEHAGVKADRGAVITEVQPGSPAAMVGLAAGMVITEANRLPVKSVDDLKKAITAKSLSEGLRLLVRTEEGTRLAMIRVAN